MFHIRIVNGMFSISDIFISPPLRQYQEYSQLFDNIPSLPRAIDLAEILNPQLQAMGLSIHPHLQRQGKNTKHQGLRSYLENINLKGEINTRDYNLHDFLNILTWLKFPLLKKQIISVSGECMVQHKGSGRPLFVDTLTQLDEAGVIMIVPAQTMKSVLATIKGRNDEEKIKIMEQYPLIMLGHGTMEHALLKPSPLFAFTIALNNEEALNHNFLWLLHEELLRYQRCGSLPITKYSLYCEGWNLGLQFRCR